MEVLLIGTLLTTVIGAFAFFLKLRSKKIDDNADAISNIEKTYVKREDYEKDKKETENHFREIEQNYITTEEFVRGIGQIQKTLEIMEEHSRDSHKTLHEKIDRLIERNMKNDE